MQLFYQEYILSDTFDLSFEESKHLTRVLRKKQGDEIAVTDGKGVLYTCVIQEANQKKTTLKILSSEEIRPSDFYIHLAIAPTKSPDRMEWMVEKITEIGVHEITLLETSNSERSFLKTDRLQKKMLSACMQSLKFRIPKLNPVTPLQTLLNSNDFENHQKYIAYVDENHKHHLFDLAQRNGNYLILIGPEGDFDLKEIQMAFSKGFKPVSLGNSRLRTETAGFAAVQILQLINR
jgi:16S rRNA (uracil1498-N3)-methyltransferase